MVIGIDHGYYAIKTKQVCFPTGIIRYEYEPYTMQNVLQYQGEYYVCGTGRQTLVKDKTANDNYYLLTLAALAQEIRKRKGERTAKVVLAAGLPLLWSSIFVTLMANKIGGLQFGIYRNCQISSRVFHTAVAALPLTKANRSDFE